MLGMWQAWTAFPRVARYTAASEYGGQVLFLGCQQGQFLQGQPERESGRMGGAQWPSVLNMQTFVCVTRRR